MATKKKSRAVIHVKPTIEIVAVTPLPEFRELTLSERLKTLRRTVKCGEYAAHLADPHLHPDDGLLLRMMQDAFNGDAAARSEYWTRSDGRPAIQVPTVVRREWTIEDTRASLAQDLIEVQAGEIAELREALAKKELVS